MSAQWKLTADLYAKQMEPWLLSYHLTCPAHSVSLGDRFSVRAKDAKSC